MSCVLRIEGIDFRVSEFLEFTNLKPYISFVKGDEIGFAKSNENTYQSNGCSFDLSEADFDRFDIQKNDAIKFLKTNFDKLKSLSEFGLRSDEIPVIDFAIYTRMLDVQMQSEYLEPELLKLTGDLNFGIEISQYIEAENDENK